MNKGCYVNHFNDDGEIDVPGGNVTGRSASQ